MLIFKMTTAVPYLCVLEQIWLLQYPILYTSTASATELWSVWA